MLKFGIDIPNFGNFSDPSFVADFAVLAEKSGWDGLFIWDHIARGTHHQVVDPWIALAAAATLTHIIRVGTMVTPLPRRRPWKVAREAVSMDHLSKGRFTLGVGVGSESGRYVEWENFNEELDLRKRGEMLDEGLALLELLWSGNEIDFCGKYYQIQRTKFIPRPIQIPRIPIWVGGNWPNKAPLSRALEWDGFCPIKSMSVPLKLDEILSVAQQIKQYREKSNNQFDIVYLVDPAQRNIYLKSNNLTLFEKYKINWIVEKIDAPFFGMKWEENWNINAMLTHVKNGPPRM